MASDTSSPTARRWELAARLRQMRLDAGRSVEEVAAELMCSPAKISRLETAGRGVQRRDVRDLCRFYGAPEAVQRELLQLAADAKKPGWWQDFRSLSDRWLTFVGLESAAVEIWDFEALRIPGLLQTPEYARALVANTRPPGEMSEETQAELVAIRARRQERLNSGELRFSAVIDEAALARSVGSQDVMIAQVDRLLETAALPTVTLQVVPFSRGSYPGVEGSFAWMHFGRGGLGDVIFVEGLLGDFLLDKQFDVERYLDVYRYTAGSAALDPEATIAWLEDWRARASP